MVNPRDPDAPIVTDDSGEDAARSRVTVGELFAEAGPTDYPTENLDLNAIRESIPPERWEELKRRFLLILAELRERRGYTGDDHGGE